VGWLGPLLTGSLRTLAAAAGLEIREASSAAVSMSASAAKAYGDHERSYGAARAAHVVEFIEYEPHLRSEALDKQLPRQPLRPSSPAYALNLAVG
jgi:hypothetical protein